MYETAGSSHTPEAIAPLHSDHGADEIVTLNIIQGELLFVDERGAVLAAENWRSGWRRYEAYYSAHGIAPKDLTAFG